MGIYVIYTCITWKLYIGCCWWQDTFTHFNIPETGMQLKTGSIACKFYYFVYVHDMCMKHRHVCVTMHTWRPDDKSRDSVLSFHPRIWGGNSGPLAYTVSAFIHWDFFSAQMHICSCIFLVADNVKSHVSSDSPFSEIKQSLTVHSSNAERRAGK